MSSGRETGASTRVATLLVVGAAICFATTGTAQALGPGGVSPLSLGAARIVFGGLLLALIALLAAHNTRPGATAPSATAPTGTATTGTATTAPSPGTPAPSATASGTTAPSATAPGATALGAPARRRTARAGSVALVVVGAVGVAAYQPAFFTGTSQNGVAAGTLVALGSAPVLTGLLEWIVRHRAPGIRWAVATVVAALGVAALTGVFGGGSGTATAPGGGITPLGIVASLGAGASYAVYALSSKALLDRRWSPTATMGATFGCAALFMLPVLLTSDLRWITTPAGSLTALWLAVVTTALAYTLFARGLRMLPASRTATLTLIEPLTATVLGVAVLHEQFTLAIVAGLLLLVAGLTILTLPLPRPLSGAGS